MQYYRIQTEVMFVA